MNDKIIEALVGALVVIITLAPIFFKARAEKELSKAKFSDADAEKESVEAGSMRLVLKLAEKSLTNESEIQVIKTKLLEMVNLYNESQTMIVALQLELKEAELKSQDLAKKVEKLSIELDECYGKVKSNGT